MGLLLGIVLTLTIATFVAVLINFAEGNRMARSIQESLANLDSQLTAAKNRILEDVAELKRVIEAQGNASAELDAAIARIDASAAELQSIDPVAEFPAQPPAEDPGLPPQPPPSEGGGTTPTDPTAPPGTTTPGDPSDPGTPAP